VIVYAPTIQRVENTVGFLEGRGIPALGLSRQDGDRHAAAQPGALDVGRGARAGGTLAFGLGINKAAVAL